MALLTYRFEITIEISREGILPEIDLIGELCLSHLESFRSDVDVLGAKLICKVYKRQRDVIYVNALGRETRR